MNEELLSLLSKPQELEKYLKLNSLEVNLLYDRSNRRSLHSRKQRLILKLIYVIADTTLLPVKCPNQARLNPCIGDLALLSIYKIEEFPFALALQRQSCTGGPISPEILLPHDLIEYTSFAREEIKKAYKEYFFSNDRIAYLESRIKLSQ